MAVVKDSGLTVPYFLHLDHLGGTALATTAAGTIDQQLAYYPYGEELLNIQSSAFGERRTFAGYESGPSGLLYAGARYYHGGWGRFMGRDPAFVDLNRLVVQLNDPQSWNSYSYARNNPLALSDSDGEFWHIVAGAAVGAVISGGIIYLQTGSLSQAGKAAVGGAVAGAMFATIGPASLASTVGVGALSSAAGNSVTRTLSGEKVNAQTLAVDAAAGALGGALGYGAGKAIQKFGSSNLNKLPDNTIVCRGGICGAKNFAKIGEVNKGLLDGSSVNASPTASIKDLTRSFPQNQFGQTTLREIRKLGGDVVPTPSPRNPFHADLKGITPQQAEKLFTPTMKNLNKVK